PDVEPRVAGDVRPGTRLAPRPAVQPVRDGDRHQLVPGGVERDLVDAVAEAVVRAQLGGMPVRLEAPRDRLLRSGEDAQSAERALVPARPFAANPLEQRDVLRRDVVAGERRGLVQDLVRRAGPAVERLHADLRGDDSRRGPGDLTRFAWYARQHETSLRSISLHGRARGRLCGARFLR